MERMMKKGVKNSIFGRLLYLGHYNYIEVENVSEFRIEY